MVLDTRGGSTSPSTLHPFHPPSTSTVLLAPAQSEGSIESWCGILPIDWQGVERETREWRRLEEQELG